MNRAFKSGLAVTSLALLLTVACKKSEEVATGEVDTPTTTTQEIAGVTNPGDISPMTAQAYIDDVTIGHEVGADGMIPAGRTGDDFAPGETVHLAMKVKDAPANATVKTVWYGPNETKVGDESKAVASGATFLTFNIPTKGWAKGDYRAEVWIGDEKVNTQQFQIVDAPKAGK